MKYLLDTNVLKESTKPQPHENVASWLSGVDDSDLAISVISVREIWRGIEKKRLDDAKIAGKIEEGASRLFDAFAGRILPVDEATAKLWGQLLGAANKHVDDTGLAATARVNDLVLVTRNVSDFADRGARLLDPFKATPVISS